MYSHPTRYNFYKSVKNKDKSRSVIISNTLNSSTIKLNNIISGDYFIFSKEYKLLFNVIIKDDNVLVYKPEKILDNIKNLKLILYKKYKAIKIIPSIGLDTREYGGRILIETHKNKYTYVGETIYEFSTLDDICLLHYAREDESIIEYGVGTIFTYLFLDKVKIKNEYCLFENPQIQYNNKNHVSFIDMNEDGDFDWKNKTVIVDSSEYFTKINDATGIILPNFDNKKIKTTTMRKILLRNYFLMHDNGGRPYKAKINYDKKIVKVYENVTDYSKLKKNIYTNYKWKLVFTTNYIKIFIGIEREYIPFRGNTILLQTDEKEYTNIHSYGVRQFNTSDEIIKYISVAGESDVLIPYAIGTEYVYDMINRRKIQISKLLVLPPYSHATGEFFHIGPVSHVNNQGFNMGDIKMKNIIVNQDRYNVQYLI
jgi:hypothetical protein